MNLSPEPLRGDPARLFPNRAAVDELPEPRAFTGDLLESGMDEADYARRFLQAFGADIDQPAVHRDPLDEPLMISEALFKDGRGRWKADKRGRGRYLPLLADAIRDPDEICVAAELNRSAGKPMTRRRYLARFTGDDGALGTAVFEWGKDGWAGVTTYQGDSPEGEQEIESFRRGVRLFGGDNKKATALPHCDYPARESGGPGRDGPRNGLI